MRPQTSAIASSGTQSRTAPAPSADSSRPASRTAIPAALGGLGDRTAHAATTDDDQRLGGAQGGGDVIPFQFPHRRYQTVVVAMDE